MGRSRGAWAWRWGGGIGWHDGRGMNASTGREDRRITHGRNLLARSFEFEHECIVSFGTGTDGLEMRAILPAGIFQGSHDFDHEIRRDVAALRGQAVPQI